MNLSEQLGRKAIQLNKARTILRCLGEDAGDYLEISKMVKRLESEVEDLKNKGILAKSNSYK